MVFPKILKDFMGIQSLTSSCGCVNFFPRNVVGNPGGGFCNQLGCCFSNLAIKVCTFSSSSCSTFPLLASISEFSTSSVSSVSSSPASSVRSSISSPDSSTSPFLGLGTISSSSSSLFFYSLCFIFC